MKKHFLRTLVVLLMACLGVGILAACNGTPETPADPIEGVWSGAKAEMNLGASGEWAFTATVDLDGNTAHIVFDIAPTADNPTGEIWFRGYFALDKQSDGSYKYEEARDSVTASCVAKLNADSKLEIVHNNLFGESAAPATLTFSTKATLPAVLNITGTKYAQFDDEIGEFNFTTPAIKVGDSALTDVQFINVGGYKVFTGKSGEYPVQGFIYKDQSKTYVFVANEVAELLDNKPTIDKTYTVQFSFGNDSHAAENASEPTDKTGKAGESITLETPDAADDWAFDGWYTKNGDKKEGNYTIAAADADGDTITLTAKWNWNKEIGNDVYENEGSWTAYDGTAHIPAWHDVLHKGETVTVTGIVKYAGNPVTPWLGAVAHIYTGDQTNANPGVCINHSNAGAAADTLWAQPNVFATIHNVMVNGVRAPEGDQFGQETYEAPKAQGDGTDTTNKSYYLKALELMGTEAGAKLTVTFSWLYNSEMYVTIVYESNDAQTYVSKSYIYGEASANALIANESYNIGLDVDAGYIKLTGIVKQEGTITEKPASMYGYKTGDTVYTDTKEIGTITSGKKFVVTGKQTTFGSTVWSGLQLTFDTNIMRPDNYVSGTDRAGDVFTKTGQWTATGVPAMDPTDTEWLTAMRPVVRDCTFTFTIDWTSAEQIVVTLEYAASATNTEASGKKFTQKYTVTAIDGSTLSTSGYAVKLVVDGALGEDIEINTNAD